MAPSWREPQHACRTPITLIETTDEQPLSQIPRLGFQVIHYHRSSLDPDSPLIVHSIGIYHTFALAQAVALSELQRTLNDCLRIGYHGRYCDLIDCSYRGLITVCKESTLDGYMFMREIPVSEFRLEKLNMSHDASQVGTRLAKETKTNTQVIDTAWPLVRLPATPEQHKEPTTPKRIARRGEHVVMHEPAPSSPQLPPLGVQFDKERQPEWPQTRVPWFDRRDDAPFRRPGQTPYAQVMAFSTAAPTSSTCSVRLGSGHRSEYTTAASREPSNI